MRFTVDAANFMSLDNGIDLSFLTNLHLTVRKIAHQLCKSVAESLNNTICNHICTMNRLTRLTICCNYPGILAAISRSCPNLEEIDVSGNCRFNGEIIEFCGFNWNDVRSYDCVRGILHKSRARCLKLRTIIISMEPTYDYVLALILSVFPCLENFDFNDAQFTWLDALCCIYGTNEDRYQHITRTYNLVSYTI